MARCSACVFFVLSASACAFADARAVVLAAQPAARSYVQADDHQVRLEFNRRIDRVRSRPALQGPDGKCATPGGLSDAALDVAKRIWPPCFAVVGLLLLDHREA